MGRHRRRLQELHGGLAETAVPPDPGPGGACARDEQARWTSLDLPGNAIAGKERPEPDFSPRPERVTSTLRKTGNGPSEFRILEHVGTVRKVGRNYVA